MPDLICVWVRVPLWALVPLCSRVWLAAKAVALKDRAATATVLILFIVVSEIAPPIRASTQGAGDFAGFGTPWADAMVMVALAFSPAR